MKKKEIASSICLAIFLLVLALGIWLLNFDKESLPDADSYEQLLLSVKYGGNTEYLKIWQNANGDYYFFLPANVSLQKSSFANLGQAVLELNGTTYQAANATIDQIQCDQPYVMHMRTEKEELEEARLFFLQSKNLPAIFIETESGTTDAIHGDREVREAANFSVYDESGSFSCGDRLEYIKSRGTSTFYNFEKKSYSIHMTKKRALLGMKSADKWILLANSNDGTLIRNKLIYDFAKNHSSVKGIDGRFVDLYLNGQYAGNYYLCEKIEIAPNRVNIRDLEDLNKIANSNDVLEKKEACVSEDGLVKAIAGIANPDDISGGYLISLTNHYGLCECGFISSMGYPYEVVSPDNASIEEVTYIQESGG